MYPATLTILNIIARLVPHHEKWQAELQTASASAAATYGLLGTFDVRPLLKFASDIFASYDSWRYQKRSERWQIGTAVLRLFHTMLATTLPYEYHSRPTYAAKQGPACLSALIDSYPFL